MFVVGETTRAPADWTKTHKDPRHPGARVVAPPANDGGVAVGGQRDGGALLGVSNCAGADQLAALLGPDTAAAGVDPHRAGARVVARTAHDGRVAGAGQRYGTALVSGPDCAGADQLAALLRPDAHIFIPPR
jgi:hypothetical protein